LRALLLFLSLSPISIYTSIFVHSTNQSDHDIRHSNLLTFLILRTRQSSLDLLHLVVPLKAPIQLKRAGIYPFTTAANLVFVADRARASLNFPAKFLDLARSLLVLVVVVVESSVVVGGQEVVGKNENDWNSKSTVDHRSG